MNILAIDFSSSRRSVAIVALDGGDPSILGELEEEGTRETHAFRMIQAVLDSGGVLKSEVDALAIGLGPGSYGGIRVALSIAQGWQVATGIKTTGVCSAAAIAETARATGHVGQLNVVVDAQRNEFYVTTFQLDETAATQCGELAIVSHADLEKSIATEIDHIGPDVETRINGVGPAYPNAGSLATLAYRERKFVPANELAPVYIRPVAFVKAPPPRTDL